MEHPTYFALLLCVVAGCGGAKNEDTPEILRPSQSLECGPSHVAASCHAYEINQITHCYDQQRITQGMATDACQWGAGAYSKQCSCAREGALGGCSRYACDLDRNEIIPVIDWYYEQEDYQGMTVADMKANCEHYQGVWLAPDSPTNFRPQPPAGTPALSACAQQGAFMQTRVEAFRYERYPLLHF